MPPKRSASSGREPSSVASSSLYSPSTASAAKKSRLPHPPIVPRNYIFSLPAARVLDWHGSGLHATAFNNALSVFFPVGETFFIHAVKNYRHVVPAGSSLEKEVQAFIEQEAVHSREHVAYNKALEPYYFVAFIEGVVWCVLWPFERIPFMALAGTVALEHLTASLGHILVSDEHLARGSQPHFAQLWYWHAVEETEHKAVAFDVYELAFGKGTLAYSLRVFAFVVAIFIFYLLFIPTFLYFVIRAGGLFDGKGWAGLFRHHWVGKEKGIMRRMGPLIKEYFRTDFHPWQHNNAKLPKPLSPPLPPL